ncbi:hypothetical protein B7486_54990, partial [cyanobacterium TDX16]
MRRPRPVLLVLLLLAAACSIDAQDEATPADDSTQATAAGGEEGDDLFLGIETGTTVISSAGYGSLTAIDLDTGHARLYDAVDGVPGDHDFRLIPLADGIAYPGGGGPLALPWSLEGSPVQLGPAWIFLPSGEPDRLWLVPQLAVPDGSPPSRAIEVDGHGRATGNEVEVPTDAFPTGAIGEQLVLQHAFDDRTTLAPSGELLPLDAPS